MNNKNYGSADDAISSLLSVRLKPNLALCFEQTPARDGVRSGADAARWIVFDPITRQSFRIGWVEHWFLTRIDGRHTTAQIIQQFRTEQPQSSLTDPQLLMLLDQFSNNNLARSTNGGSGSKKSRVQSWVSSIVVWQIRGLQPDRWLAWLAPHTKSIFSRAAVQFWICAAVVTLCAVFLEFQRLVQQSLSWDWMLRPSHGGMLLAVFLVTRALHELGHALVCKRFGVRCPDIGLFLILGAPCVYCDVSESWRLPSRWKRAAVAAAGMYVELVVATLAAWIWIATIEGPVNTLALQTMFVCSVSTLLINANPLMRFDGYYILADWLDETNLRSKADLLAHARLQRIVLGADVDSGPAVAANSRTRFLIGFSFAGWMYRALLSVTIATVLVAIYSNWNLVWVGRILAAIVIMSWWGVPMMKLMNALWRNAGAMGKRARLTGIAAMIVGVIVLVPIPKRRFASGWIEPRESQSVYAGAHARFVQCKVTDGATITNNDPLFVFTSLPLALESIRRESECTQAKLRLDALAERASKHGGEADPSSLEQELEEAKRLRDNTLLELNDLKIGPPKHGVFYVAAAPPAIDPLGIQPPIANRSWCGPEQIGRTVQPETLLGTICGLERIAVIPLDDSQLADVAPGTEVRLRVWQAECTVVTATVTEVVPLDQSFDGWQQHAHSTARNPSHSATRFAAIAHLPSEVATAIPGSTVDAVFVARHTTIASFCASWLTSNLRLLAN